MPRAKKQTGGLFLGVSPWQDASKAQEEADVEPSDEQQPGCSVVELPLVVGAAAAAAAPAAGPASMPIDSKLAAAPAAPAAAPSGGWQAKKRKPAADEAQASGAMAAEPGGSSCPLATHPSAGAAGGEQPPAEPAPLELEGTAYLALLPNGSITGHLVCPPSIFRPGRRSFGLMAEAVLAGRECTRDADWGVLRLTLINFSPPPAGAAGQPAGGDPGAAAAGGGGGAAGARAGAGARGGPAEVSLLVERTEGDAMRLRAPVPWQGIELESLPELDAPCTCASSAPGLSLDFRCQQLMEGPAADALLGRLQPSLVFVPPATSLPFEPTPSAAMSLSARLSLLCLTVLLAGGAAQAACPFAALARGAGSSSPHSRKLAQTGFNPQLFQPPNVPVDPVLPGQNTNPRCIGGTIENLGALGAWKQNAVDAIVKSIAKEVIWYSADPKFPGTGGPGAPNPTVPMGGLLRAAFHECGTYDRQARTGGCNGSFRFEFNDIVNQDLLNPNFFFVDKLITRWRAEINRRLALNKAVPAGTKISWADTTVLAGASAVIATGGPVTLWDKLKLGRADWATRADNTLRLPIRILTFNGVACTFLNMGFTLQDLVVLSAGHTLGFADGGKMTADPSKFLGWDYFQLVQGRVALFPTDNALYNFRTRPLVDRWASPASKQDFFAAFEQSYIKMTALNVVWRNYPQPAEFLFFQPSFIT
ncbi:L-ascorbate peroxidase 6 isoform X1 isoform B [Chlorella sorokiniana]|uniref:L-ascorbate peroxidase 6 isoform X1 isoform B n=1 Tax=Chlorella sorokiniana TaxID=3076 RepID=A0A2P6TMQ8_CHLSO|nr:L-ascorbate peroxidase 6 isoform X1 isoform B [Chlorella sorokiniana]|eukprot:PRW45610.1 L-ascorbate peroxidase 6 isoform X1 isoform B [Chlorella sorokiniana]